jgi:hypothetical protein
MAASGQLFMCGPSFVEYITSVLPAMPSSSIFFGTVRT